MEVAVTVAVAAFVVCAASKAADPAPAVPAASDPVQTIVVSGQKMSVKTLVDRKVYDVTGDIQASFGSASDVLAVIPSIDVDPDGGISYRGDSNLLILIDGKPSALLTGATAGDALRSIPARDIERIEVLSTPPAQFKAEGVSGVINIVMRRNRPDGIAGSVQASLGDMGRSFGAADIGFHGGGFTTSINAGFRHDARRRMIESDVLFANGNSSSLVHDTSVLRERAQRQMPTAGAKASYDFDDKDRLTAAVSWQSRGGLRTYTQLNDTMSGADVLAASQRQSRGHDPRSQVDTQVGYIRRFDREGEELELSLHRSASRQRERYDYTNDSFVPPAPTDFSYLILLEEETDTELTADYTLPFGEAQELKLGYSHERTDFHYANNGATPDLTNNYRFQYLVNAAYASWQAKGDAWTSLLGLRAEYTDTDSLLITDDVSNSGSYAHVFPSLHFERKLSDTSTLSFGASRRIRRPDPDDLSPYVDHEYTPDLRSGNPRLRPQLTQSYEAGYGFEGSRRSLQLTAYYRRNADSTTEVTEILDQGLTLTTKTNLPKNDSMGLEFSTSGHLATGLGYTVSANPFHAQIESKEPGASGLKSTQGINGKLKLDYRPTATDSAQLTFARTDKRLTPQGQVGATNVVNVGLKHRVSPDLSIVATVSDVFNGQRNERFLDTPTESGTFLRAVKGRIIQVGVSYAFGSTQRDDQFEYDQ